MKGPSGFELVSFHADQEAVRILGNSIKLSRLGLAALRGDDVPAAPLAAAAASAHRPKRAALPQE